MPMFSPSGWFTSSRNRSTLSRLSMRLADAHQNDVGDGQPGVLLGEDHLVQHFRRRQVPHLASDGGGAEGAAHPAAHLGGDADGVSVVVLHEHRLDAVAVRQLPQVLHGAVQLGDLLTGHRGRRQIDSVSCSFSRRGLERLVISSKEVTPLVEPGKDLLAPEGRLPHAPSGSPSSPPGSWISNRSYMSSLCPLHAADVKAVGTVALGPEGELPLRAPLPVPAG